MPTSDQVTTRSMGAQLEPESSGDGSWIDVDDGPYDSSVHFKKGVNYVKVINGTLDLPAVQFRGAQWDPTTPDFQRFGKRYLMRSGMYEYRQLLNTENEAHYSYKVKMDNMIGPNHADQEQFLHLVLNTPRRSVVKVTTKTHNFPYSNAFNIEQM